MAMVVAQYAGASFLRTTIDALSRELGQALTAENVNRWLANRFPGKANKKRRALVRRTVGGSNKSAGIARTRAPVAYGTSRRFQMPRYNRAAGVNGTVSVKHTEMVSLQRNFQGFTLKTITIQPGLDSSFPWLAALAANYQQYTIKNLCLRYSAITGTSVAGDILMAWCPDAQQLDPTSDVQMTQFRDNISTNVWKDTSLNVNLGAPKKLYVRRGTVADADLKTYDLGKFYIASSTSTNSNGNVVGRLYLDYDIEFFEPKPAECPTEYIVAGNIAIGDTFNATRLPVAIKRLANGFEMTSTMSTGLSVGMVLNDLTGTPGSSVQVLQNCDSLAFLNPTGTGCSSTAVTPIEAGEPYSVTLGVSGITDFTNGHLVLAAWNSPTTVT